MHAIVRWCVLSRLVVQVECLDVSHLELRSFCSGFFRKCHVPICSSKVRTSAWALHISRVTTYSTVGTVFVHQGLSIYCTVATRRMWHVFIAKTSSSNEFAPSQRLQLRRALEADHIALLNIRILWLRCCSRIAVASHRRIKQTGSKQQTHQRMSTSTTSVDRKNACLFPSYWKVFVCDWRTLTDGTSRKDCRQCPMKEEIEGGTFRSDECWLCWNNLQKVSKLRTAAESTWTNCWTSQSKSRNEVKLSQLSIH